MKVQRRLCTHCRHLACLVGLPLTAQWAVTEKIDLDAVYKIKEEGLQRSKVMEIESYLTDVYGPRLTGSPNIKEAADWAQKTMKEWGLANVKTRNVAVRPRLAEPALRRDGDDPARLSAHRLPESVDARHQRSRDRRSRDGCHHERQGFRHLPRQAARQVRAVGRDARGAAAVRRHRPPLHRCRTVRVVETAGRRWARRTRPRQRRSGLRSPPHAVLDRRRRGGGARLQPRRRRHAVRAGRRAARSRNSRRCPRR